MISVVNNRVACSPFANTGIEKTVKSGFATAKQKGSVTPLTVVFDSGMYAKGSTVYVRSELAFHPQIPGEIFEINGQKFILIPADQILVVEAP